MRMTKHSKEAGEEIKKGPWKAEEDEVLICHVSKYGPRDWSSIRSKGLLQRTGKSCRLRWVNKLRPNLKNGTKFSAEEERVVIELQGQFGNRWARIATHLPGRTDNDVKNFWSSRQKRLARLLQNPSYKTISQSLSKSSHQNRNRNRNINEAPKLNSSPEEESSSSLNNNILNPKPISSEPYLFQLEFDPVENNPTQNQELNLLPFPTIPEFQPKEEFENITNFFDVFENVEMANYGGDNEMGEFPFMPSCFGAEGHIRIKYESPEIIFDELPLDIFDQIEPFQSPHRNVDI